MITDTTIIGLIAECSLTDKNPEDFQNELRKAQYIAATDTTDYYVLRVDHMQTHNKFGVAELQEIKHESKFDNHDMCLLWQAYGRQHVRVFNGIMTV